MSEAFTTSLEQASRCVLCREPIAEGMRCLCVNSVRSDGARIISFVCLAGCARAIAVAQQLYEQ